MKKLNLLLICGGPSPEHNVSLVSAKSILQNINKEKYNIITIALDDANTFYKIEPSTLDEVFLDKAINVSEIGDEVRIVPGKKKITLLNKNFSKIYTADVVFPIIHGPGGEDGTLQGLLEIAGVPFVGCKTASSALCMDKDFCKKILQKNNIPVSEYFVFYKGDSAKQAIEKIKSSFQFPVFIKPANMGSSIGVHKCLNEENFNNLIDDALLYDNKILIEESIKGDEIEVAVMGNSEPKCSPPGRYEIQNEFYDFNSKYLSEEDSTRYFIPAYEDKQINERISQLALNTYKALSCSGLARVDFFKTKNDVLIVNEINTLPGFTPISMYPMLWKNIGLNYSDLIDKLINYALEK